MWTPEIDGPITLLLRGPADPETGEAEVLGVRPGYRVNTTIDVLIRRPDLEAWRVIPDRLARVWAGDDPDNPKVTVALKFADEAEARSALAEFWIEPETETAEA